MNVLLAVVLSLGATWLLAHIVVTGVVLSRANKSHVEELRYLQGSTLNIMRGQLEHAPSGCDYRVVQGLEWDGKEYISQARLSTEAIKAAFFQ